MIVIKFSPGHANVNIDLKIHVSCAWVCSFRSVTDGHLSLIRRSPADAKCACEFVCVFVYVARLNGLRVCVCRVNFIKMDALD